jgi:hypothetical protein
MSDDPERDVPEGAAVFPAMPAELGIDPLLLAVLHAIVFLEGSEEHIVQPDAAEEAVDRLAGYLQRVTGAQLQRLQEDLDTLAAFASQQGWPKSQARFIKEFVSFYGIGR